MELKITEGNDKKTETPKLQTVDHRIQHNNQNQISESESDYESESR